MSFEHPGWWLPAFRIGSPAMAAVCLGGAGIWLLLSPVFGPIIGAVLLACIVPLWSTGRHIGHRVVVSDDTLSFMPYFGRSRQIRWNQLTTVREFKVLGWTARRQYVMLEAGSDWVAFAHDIDRFDELRALVKDHAAAAATKGAPPWWARLLRLGSV